MWQMKCIDVLSLNIDESYFDRLDIHNMTDNVRVEVGNSIQNIVYRVVNKTPISDSYVGDLSKIRDILHGTH